MKRYIAAALFGSLPFAALAQATFHGDNAHTGVYSSAGPKQLGGVKWAFKAEGPIVTSPTIADGVVYFGSAVAIFTRSMNRPARKNGSSSPGFRSPHLPPWPTAHSILCLPPVDWLRSRSPRDRPSGSMPLNTSGSSRQRTCTAIFLPRRPFRMPGTSLPLRRRLQRQGLFRQRRRQCLCSGCAERRSAMEVRNRDVVHSSPAVVGNTVYMGSWDSYLYALDAKTGQQKWAFKSGEDDSIHNQVGFQSSPAVADGTVYVGCRDAHVYALDAATGRKRWDYPTSKSWVIGTPAVRNGLVYVGTSDSARLMALDAKTGRLRFNFDAKAYMFSSPALAGRNGVLRRPQRQALRRRYDERETGMGVSDRGVEEGCHQGTE